MSNNWILNIDRSHLDKVKETTKNGKLSFDWPKCKSYDFEEYIIYKQMGHGDRVELTRQTTNQFEDNSYIGEWCTYYITAATSNNTYISWGELEKKGQVPQFIFAANTDNQYFIKYIKTNYYAGVDSILIKQYFGGVNNRLITVGTFTDYNDTICELLDLTFGEQVRYEIEMIPKNNTNREFTIYIPDLTATVGFPFEEDPYGISDVKQVAADEFVFVGYGDSLKKFSTSEIKFVDVKALPNVEGCYNSRLSYIEYSPAGKYMTAYILCTEKYLNSKTDNVSFDDTRNLSNLTGKFNSIPISDNSIGVVTNSNLCSSQHTKVTIETGIGSYQLNNLKGINDMILSELPFNAKLVTDFPINIYYRPSISFLYDNIAWGFSYTYLSTGSRISTKDYSGEYRFDMVTSSHAPAVHLDIAITSSNKIDPFIRILTGARYSQLNMDEYFKVFEELVSEENMDFKSTNFFIEPSVYLTYSLGSILIESHLGYDITLGNNTLSSSSEDTELYHPESGNKIRPNWNGIRVGIGVSYVIRAE